MSTVCVCKVSVTQNKKATIADTEFPTSPNPEHYHMGNVIELNISNCTNIEGQHIFCQVFVVLNLLLDNLL